MGITIECDTKDLEKLINSVKGIMAPQKLHSAMAAALNRTLTFVSAETKRQVQEEYAVTKSIDKSLDKEKATRSKLVAVAKYTDKPIPMFVFKYTAARNQYRSPISILIKKSNGMQSHGKNPNMFKAYGSKRKIMIREDGEKSLRTAYTLSIPQMVASDEVYNVIAKKAEDYLYERLKHEIEWRLSQVDSD